MTNEIMFSDGVDLTNIDCSQYPSGEPLIKTHVIPENGIWGFKSTKLLVRPKTMNQFVGAMFWVDAFYDRYGFVPELVLPLVPGSRQDRLMGSGSDYLFTAKSVAKMINERNFPKVTILDPHSDVISALIDRCKVISAGQIIGDCYMSNHNQLYFRNNKMVTMAQGYYSFDGVIAPDAGASKRAAEVAKFLGVPLFQGGKTRDTKTGKITNFWIHDIPLGGNFLIVDDLCDGGGTFVGLAEEIRKQCKFAELSLYVTHGLFTKGTDELRKYFVNIITTDSNTNVKGGGSLAGIGGLTVINACDLIMGVRV